MPKIKTYKALTKRVWVTKRGTVMKRASGQDHFNTRDRSNTTRNKRRDGTLRSKIAMSAKRILAST